MSDMRLHDWHLVILRPAPQAQPLVDYVRTHGGEPILLPMLEIEALPLSPRELEQAVHAVRQAKYVFIPSANAIQMAPTAIIAALKAKQNAIITMGAATTASVESKQLTVFFTPDAGSTSETLLTQPFLQPDVIANQTIVLLAGIDGRPHLAQTLTQRGAKVATFCVYQQRMPDMDLTPWFASMQQQLGRHCFIATSLHILERLVALTTVHDSAWLLQQPLIVISERIAEAATKFGFKQIVIARSPQPTHIGQALLQLLDVKS